MNHPVRPAWSRRAIALAAVVTLSISACARDGATPAARDATVTVPLSFLRDGVEIATLEVEVADSPTEREVGLMGRTSVPAGTGMAFLFDRPAPVRFWMKDTLIPLSIAFWDADGTVVAILDMAPCDADPCPTYGPDVAVAGAVEVGLGALAAAGIRVGDVVRIAGSGPTA